MQKLPAPFLREKGLRTAVRPSRCPGCFATRARSGGGGIERLLYRKWRQSAVPWGDFALPGTGGALSPCALAAIREWRTKIAVWASPKMASVP